MQTEQLESQVKILQKKLHTIKTITETGKQPKLFYSLSGKIEQLKKLIAEKKHFNYLAK